jgi:signal transduction histidine kinase
VNEETDRLNHLVSDAIQISRIEAGKVTLHRSLVSPKDVIDTVITQMRTRLEDRPVEKNLGAGVSDVYVDRDLIQLSLRQLVDNAIKHAPGHTAIRIGAEGRQKDFAFWVIDDGPGIATGEEEHIFEKFYRGQANRDAVPGSGVGLSVVREIARAHGGDASVASESGKGSRFVITLPLAREETK